MLVYRKGKCSTRTGQSAKFLPAQFPSMAASANLTATSACATKHKLANDAMTVILIIYWMYGKRLSEM